MLIIPKHKELSHFVQATEGLSLGLDSLASILEQSAMWRSKLSPKRTWLQRLKKAKWMLRLSGRILKPSQEASFMDAYTASLEVIPVSHFRSQESARELQILGTCGPTSESTSEQSGLSGASSKMLEGTSISDSEKSNEIWNNWVTQLTQEYSVRRKLSHHTVEKESLSWPTPTARDYRASFAENSPAFLKRLEHSRGVNLVEYMQRCGPQDREKINIPGKRQELWPTPSAGAKGGPTGLAGGAGNREKLANMLPELEAKAMGCSKLNPAWVEQLMGLPPGQTSLGSWGTVSCLKPLQKPG